MNNPEYSRFLSGFLAAFPYPPTTGQDEALKRIANFLAKSTSGDTYLLKGYAGTGKTTIISVLVKSLPKSGLKTVLMAPTGRAAKVMATYAKKGAFTIHRKIYRPRQNDGARISYALAPNQHVNTLFIVDEASMISDSHGLTENFFGGQNLLKDLIDFVAAGENCRLLLVGDNAQLPPVSQNESPALEIMNLTRNYGLRAGHFELTEVVRQEKDSGILKNATDLRNEIRAGGKNILFSASFKDFERVPGSELGEKLASDYSALGPEEVVVVCRSNRSANNYNRQIRFSGMYFEEEICAGDYLMCVKNNYFWLEEKSEAGFIANGDTLKITRIQSFEEKFGFRFADVSVVMVDYPDQPAFEVKIILDSLYTEAPALTKEQSAELFKQISESYPEATSRTAKMALVTKDPYYQALQIKFAYAVTCHKAQGGQWKNVFVDQGYLTEEMIDTGYLRWLYTAITRASEKVYMVNFQDTFFYD
ncbi:MAG TPA: AAA family ATPase [Bacteroidia bacterium]|nr:AAA family ATPase [Bacteroidia bacterium]